MSGRSLPPGLTSNPTLYPGALMERELSPGFKWHSHSSSPRSSQVFCLSAFGTLRSFPNSDRILEALFSRALPHIPARDVPQRWTIEPEFENPEILSEHGTRQPTSIDVLCRSPDAVICIESKFATDAAHGFGGCSQFQKKKCAGFRGPGSDIQTGTDAWCRLEIPEGHRTPRSYWSLGRHWFRPEVFRPQDSSQFCPLGSSNYQLMRNFLFAASLAKHEQKPVFGVLTIGPRLFAPVLSRQVAAFQRDILQEQYADLISFLDYESYAAILESFGEKDSTELARFVRERIRTIVDLPAQVQKQRGISERPATT